VEGVFLEWSSVVIAGDGGRWSPRRRRTSPEVLSYDRVITDWGEVMTFDREVNTTAMPIVVDSR